MRIEFKEDQFPEATPGDTLELMATGTVSDDGKYIIVDQVEDQSPVMDDESEPEEEIEMGEEEEIEEEKPKKKKKKSPSIVDNDEDFDISDIEGSVSRIVNGK